MVNIRDSYWCYVLFHLAYPVQDVTVQMVLRTCCLSPAIHPFIIPKTSVVSFFYRGLPLILFPAPKNISVLGTKLNQFCGISYTIYEVRSIQKHTWLLWSGNDLKYFKSAAMYAKMTAVVVVTSMWVVHCMEQNLQTPIANQLQKDNGYLGKGGSHFGPKNFLGVCPHTY